MRFLLQNNRSEFRNRYQSGLASQIWVPLNAGRYIGADNQSSVFKNRPDTDSIKLTDWISNQISLGNITVPIAQDDNGLISELPLGSVAINADTNALSITNLDSVTFNTSSGVRGLDISEVSGYSYVRLGDYDGDGLGLQLDLNDFTGVLSLGDVNDLGGNTKIVLDDSSLSILLEGATTIKLGGDSYNLASAEPPSDGKRYVMTWTNNTVDFDEDRNGIYTGSGGIPSNTIASVQVDSSFTIKTDKVPATNFIKWDNSVVNTETLTLSTSSSFQNRSSSVILESLEDNTATSTIELNVSNVSGATSTSILMTENRVSISGLPTYADDAAAGVGGLVTNNLYKTASGVLMIKL